MATDIKLDTADGSWVTVEASVLKIEGADLMLESAERRTPVNAHRRALVHDPKDGLTLNWAGDYPGGVTIKGNVSIPEKLTVSGDLIVEESTTTFVDTDARNRRGGPRPTTKARHLLAEINELHKRISELEARIGK